MFAASREAAACSSCWDERWAGLLTALGHPSPAAATPAAQTMLSLAAGGPSPTPPLPTPMPPPTTHPSTHSGAPALLSCSFLPCEGCHLMLLRCGCSGVCSKMHRRQLTARLTASQTDSQPDSLDRRVATPRFCPFFSALQPAQRVPPRVHHRLLSSGGHPGGLPSCFCRLLLPCCCVCCACAAWGNCDAQVLLLVFACRCPPCGATAAAAQ